MNTPTYYRIGIASLNFRCILLRNVMQTEQTVLTIKLQPKRLAARTEVFWVALAGEPREYHPKTVLFAQKNMRIVFLYTYPPINFEKPRTTTRPEITYRVVMIIWSRYRARNRAVAVKFRIVDCYWPEKRLKRSGATQNNSERNL